MYKHSSHQMYKVFSLVLRRMRAPLNVLIVVYAISVLGFVLIPGVDEHGEPWRMGFFHSFYFVSYMATTIGFGEIPYPFTDAQRFWALFTLYLTVIAWLYAIGKILTLVQDPALKRAVTENRFSRSVLQLKQPFYIVCGYGDTGCLVTKALTSRGIRVVAIDIKQERIDELVLDELRLYVPGLVADAGDPTKLNAAGLNSPYCMAVLALTNDDHTNLEIAINSKLLNPNLRVISRAETQDTQDNMASFGTDHILNPFEAFAEQLAISLHSPDLDLIFEWLSQPPHTLLKRREEPPRGNWIICGYGRFGKAMDKYLKLRGVQTTIVEADPVKTGCAGRCIEGRGTEAVTLREAHIESAAGIVAGTSDDANNLSILMTAKELNPKLYTVARQNKRGNTIIFNAADINRVMQYSAVLSLKVLALISAPLLSDFLRLARRKDDEWAEALTPRLKEIAHDVVPDIWTRQIDDKEALTISNALSEKQDIRLGHITADPHRYSNQLRCIPLLIKRDDEFILLPELRDPVKLGDQILFCGSYESCAQMDWTLQNYNALRYITTGETRSDGIVWRWLANR